MTERTPESLGLRADLRSSVGYFRGVAEATWAELDRHPAGCSVQVTLEPGDATAYHLMITTPSMPHVGGTRFAHTSEWVVTLLNLNGRSYQWNPGLGLVHPSYALSHWTGDTHTATIVAAFLTLLAEEINGGD